MKQKEWLVGKRILRLIERQAGIPKGDTLSSAEPASKKAFRATESSLNHIALCTGGYGTPDVELNYI